MSARHKREVKLLELGFLSSVLHDVTGLRSGLKLAFHLSVSPNSVSSSVHVLSPGLMLVRSLYCFFGVEQIANRVIRIYLFWVSELHP